MNRIATERLIRRRIFTYKMSEKLNLDRGAIIDINYPIGVKEEMKIIYNDLATLDDVFEVNISTSFSSRKVWKKVSEGADLSRSVNFLLWKIHFEHDEIQERKYYYEIRNITKDWIEFKGYFIATKTIKE